MFDNSVIDKSLKKYEGYCNASFGELLQGVSIDNDDFLVTFPIDLHSKVYFYHDPRIDTISIYPTYKFKVKKFIESVAGAFKLKVTGTFLIESDIPEGKGLSSSTADMVAAFKAIENFAGAKLDVEKAGQILRSIEPSDGLLYSGSVAYKHRKCVFIKHLGYFPPTHVIAIDEGGVLDTIRYNKIEKDYKEEEKKMYSLLLKDLVHAFAANDLERIGFVAMQSALMNQKYNNKKNLMHAIDLMEQINAIGIITTHSGTCIGMIMHPEHKDVPEAFESVKNAFPNDKVVVYKTL